MSDESLTRRDQVIVEREHVQTLFDALVQRGYKVLGPTLRDGAIVYDELTSMTDLPAGWTDEQDGGTYRLKKRGDQALFGYTVGPHSWKKFLFPPIVRLWQAQRRGASFEIEAEPHEPPKMAFLGVRSCELHALAIQDKIFANGTYVDPLYKARRDRIFIVALNCGHAEARPPCLSAIERSP